MDHINIHKRLYFLMLSISGVKLKEKCVLDVHESSSERSKNTSFEGPVL